MKLLITAGPTREALDPVRFLSNRSSGKMGYAVASVAQDRGHEVILISGPVSIEPPNVPVIPVVTADQMFDAVDKQIEWCDALVMAAAVADWRPVGVSKHKIKKAAAPPVIRLEQTPDILKQVFPKKGNKLYVGFAAETENLEKEAIRKLQEKGLDLIVANDVSAADAGFEVDNNRVILFGRGGACEALPLMPKKKVAARILDWIEEHHDMQFQP
jgi:phosphopantothenoylcysteine decarboxylase / phosphopantothenate---cysteine ligase